MSLCIVKHSNGVTSVIEGTISVQETGPDITIWWSTKAWHNGSSFKKDKVKSVQIVFRTSDDDFYETKEK